MFLVPLDVSDVKSMRKDIKSSIVSTKHCLMSSTIVLLIKMRNNIAFIAQETVQ